MRDFARPMLILTIVLLIPIVPFLLFGDVLEAWLAELFVELPSPLETSALVAGVLALDILLPVPSSVVSTAGGAHLGTMLGTLASWAGLSIGAVAAFGVARRWGRPVALWFSKAEELDRMERLSGRYGPWIVVLARPLPILAEASVLLLGVHRLSWRRFLPAVLLSNLGIALAYSGFGDFAKEQQWLPAALAFSGTLPVLIAVAVRKRLSAAAPDEDIPNAAPAGPRIKA